MKNLSYTLGAGFLAVAMFASVNNAAAFSPVHPGRASINKKLTDNDVSLVALQRQPSSKFKRKNVRLITNERPGTIIVDTNNKFLYFIEPGNKATRYGIGVGREGFGWSGIVRVQRKAEWPSWTPPKQMIARERANGHILPPFMEGGINNPLGARALYLFNGRGDSGFRIHGTNQPWTIGLNMSSGCIRMMNRDVEHLYSRVGIGAKVVVIGPGNHQGNLRFQDKGVDFFRQLFASLD